MDVINWGEVSNWAMLFIAGALGGLVRQLVVGKGNLILWSRWYDKKTGKHGIDLGILSSIIIGGVVGIIVDQSFMTAFSWGLSGSYLLEEIIKRDMNPPKEGG